MRVTLLHNKSAGSENHAAEQLQASVRRAGHEVVDTVSSAEKLLSSLQAVSSELVVIAGGDGTVSRAACALAGSEVPLTVLPLGTANNTALTLGVRGNVDELVQHWSMGRFVPFDLAALGTDDSMARFSEGVGWGVFPSVIARTKQMPEPAAPKRTLERDRRVFRDVIGSAKPCSYEIDLDGTRVAGDFLLVEVMNIPFLGPQLALSPASDPSDGLLELVVATESERPALLELAATGRLRSGTRLRTFRGRHLEVQTDDTALHRDGSLVPHAAERVELSLDVSSASVRYLVESRAGQPTFFASSTTSS
jgi:diacylglycerol kinase family enzyme